MAVTLKLENIIGREKVLRQGMPGIIKAAAQSVRSHLLLNWRAAKGGDESALESLTPAYAKRKAGGKGPGRRPVPDLNLSGELYRGLTQKMTGKSSALVYFSGIRNQNVARGNYAKRPSMMELSDRFKNRLVNAIRDAIRKASTKGITR
jgi:hypothetical protein